jgi:hypothetical protein
MVVCTIRLRDREDVFRYIKSENLLGLHNNVQAN